MITDRLSGLAALDRTSVTIVTSDNMCGGGDRKKGRGENGEGGKAREHVDTAENADVSVTEAVDELR